MKENRKKFDVADFISNEETPVETRDNKRVIIYTTNRQGEYPVVGDILGPNGKITGDCSYWSSTGDFKHLVNDESPFDLVFKGGRRWTNGELSRWLREGSTNDYREILDTSTGCISAQYSYLETLECNSCPDNLKIRVNKGDWTEPISVKNPINSMNIDKCVYYDLRFDKTGGIRIKLASLFECRRGYFYGKTLDNTSELPLDEFLEKLKNPDYLVNEIRRSDKTEHKFFGPLIDDENWSKVEEKIREFNYWYLDFEDLSDIELINSMKQKLKDYCGRFFSKDYIGLVSLVNFKTSNL